MARVGERDREAFELLYGRYVRSVFGLALRRLGDRGHAEDAVQEAFAAIWRSASTYRPERGAAGGWLYTVARNAIVDRLRRNGPAADAELPELASPEPGPAQQAEDSDVAWRVHRALEELQPREREVIELAYWSGMSQSEVAEYPPPPARNGEDPDAKRPRAPRVGAGRRAAVNREPTLDELIGADTTGAERERLQHVHELLLEAGPPPELTPKLEAGPTLEMTLGKRRRVVKQRAMLLLAAALALSLVFLAGYAVGNQRGKRQVAGDGCQPQAQGHAARARRAGELEVWHRTTGNWPMTLSVVGLPKLPPHNYYEVYLFRDGKLVGLLRGLPRHQSSGPSR